VDKLETNQPQTKKFFKIQDQELIDQAEEKVKKNSSNLVPSDKAGTYMNIFSYGKDFLKLTISIYI
jgi:hypothetical protein